MLFNITTVEAYIYNSTRFNNSVLYIGILFQKKQFKKIMKNMDLHISCYQPLFKKSTKMMLNSCFVLEKKN